MHPSHIYIHIPFCARRCSYCDFSIAVRRNVPVDEYLRLLGRELDLRYGGGEPWPVSTIYLGGGTPSRLGADGIARLLAMIFERVSPVQGAEITMEVNPDDVTADDAARWRAAGVNRISLGAQSFDDRALQWMHRIHDSAAIPAAFDAIRGAGFDDVSIDLIFALPSILERDWRADLNRAIELKPTHVSLYGLTVENRAPLGRQIARGEVVEAPEEQYEAEFLLAHELLSASGYEHYEVSSFARPDRRARHNSSYWQGVGYAGLGPGAHEFAPPVRRWNAGAFAEWSRQLELNEDPVEGSEVLTDENKIAEAAYLGLRTSGGLTISGAEAAHVSRWLSEGWAVLRDDNRLVLTASGWLRLDSLAASLTLFRSC
jgi:oxygen-independent coproporphyrinogen-3 oxidase